MTRGRWLAVVGTAVALGVADVAAQQALFTARRELVRVDVLVTDRGQPVKGLSALDFHVTDNGVPQTVDLVGTEGTAINLVIVLDTSGSVSGDRLDRLRRASRSAIGALRTGDHVAVLGFNHIIGRGLALTGNLGGAVNALERAPVGGETSLFDASYAGLTLAESLPGRALVIVLSDGLDTSSWLTPALVLDAARRSPVVVYGVSVRQPPPNVNAAKPADIADAKVYAELAYGASVPPAAPVFLRDLTTASGGTLFEVDSSRNLESLFAGVVSEFRSRYVIGYTATGVADAGWHRIQVEIPGRRNLNVKARDGYQGPGD